MIAVLLLAFAMAQGQAAAPPRDAAPPAHATGTASIAGRVVERESGRPLHRAIVMLVSSDSTRTEPRRTLADEQGRYAFTGLAAGEYGIAAGPPELRATHLYQSFGRPSPGVRWNVPRTGVRLETGQTRGDIDFALMRALAIEGRVLDAAGEPLTDVHVRLVSADGRDMPSNDARSDDLGAYRLFGLRPGRYRVCAEPDGDRATLTDGARLVRTCHPSSAGDHDAADVVLSETDRTGVDIQVQLHGTLTVTGTVVDSAGLAVASPRVSALPADRHAGGGYADGENGRFVLRNLVPGQYILRASIGGPANPSDPRPPARPLEIGWAPVDVTAGDVQGVVIRLSLPQRIRGRIQFERPAPGASPSQMTVNVISRTMVSRSIDGGSPRAQVGSDMSFELTDVYALPLTIAVTGLPDGWAVKAVRYRGRDIRGMPTVLADESPPGFLEIVATDAVARPRVRLTGPDAAEADFRVVLLPTDRARWGGGPESPNLKPLADGSLDLGAVVPGEYLIAALSIQDMVLLSYDDARRLDQFAEIATRITLAPGDAPALDLKLLALPEARR